MIAIFQNLKACQREEELSSFSTYRTRNNGWKRNEKISKLKLRRNFWIMIRKLGNWINSGTACLLNSQKYQARFLNQGWTTMNLGWLEDASPGQGVGLEDLQSPNRLSTHNVPVLCFYGKFKKKPENWVLLRSAYCRSWLMMYFFYFAFLVPFVLSINGTTVTLLMYWFINFGSLWI